MFFNDSVVVVLWCILWIPLLYLSSWTDNVYLLLVIIWFDICIFVIYIYMLVWLIFVCFHFMHCNFLLICLDWIWSCTHTPTTQHSYHTHCFKLAWETNGVLIVFTSGNTREIIKLSWIIYLVVIGSRCGIAPIYTFYVL